MAIWISLHLGIGGHGLSSLELAVHERPLPQILATLIHDFELPIAYSGVAPNARVSLNCGSCSVEQLLDQLFTELNGSWKKVGSHYVLQFDPEGRGRLQGSIVLRGQEEPLVGGRLWLVSTDDETVAFKTRTSSRGWFTFGNIPAGPYRVVVQMQGFQDMDVGTIRLQAHEKKTAHFQTDMIVLPPGDMIVTPGHYQIFGPEPTLSTYRTKQELEQMPHLANDLLRAHGTLPGANRDNLSARPRSFGGLEGEVRIELDGMILRDPFHAKELGGAVSAIDRDTVSGLEWQAGGYTVDYGNAMGGVLAIESKSPAEKGTMVGISLTDLNVFHKDVFAGGRGQYFVSARSGNLGLILEMIDFQEDSPSEGDAFNSGYFDSFSKIHYILNEKHAVTGHALISRDVVDYGASFSTGEGNYEDHAFWVNVDSFWGEDLYSQTHVALSDYTDRRVGFAQTLFSSIDYADNRDVHQFRVGQRWQWSKPAWELRGGWYVEDGRAGYDYHHRLDAETTTFSSLRPESATDATYAGEAYEGFLAARVRFNDALVGEFGGRYDYQTWISKHQWSPRFNLAWTVTPRTQVKIAAGKFHQARQLHQLQVEDGQTEFDEPAKAEHYLLGFQHVWGAGFRSRLELFHKPVSRPAMRFENLWSPNFLFDQLEGDRIFIHPESSTVQGAEGSLGWERAGFGSFALSYTWGKSWDQIEGQRRYRRHDQRHTVNLHANMNLGKRWFGHLVWNYHSGWRTTDIKLISAEEPIEVAFGPINGKRLPAQHRLDLRFSRKALKNKGFSWHIDIINLYNHENHRGYDSIYLTEAQELTFEPSTGIPLILSFGVNWRR